MSKRKQVRPERRRTHVEINLLAADEEKGPLALSRRGCSLPFFGGVLVLLAYLVQFKTLA